MTTETPNRRLLFVVGQYWPIVGGTENQTRWLARALSRLGFEIEIWTGRWDPVVSRSEIIDGLWIRRLGLGWRVPIKRMNRYAFMFALFAHLLRHGRRFDVILVQQLRYPALLSGIAARLLGRPCVMRVSSTGSTSDIGSTNEWRGRLRWAVLRRIASRVVATSASAEHELLVAGLRPDQIASIPNGIPMPTPKKPQARLNERIRIVTIGGLRREKRIDILLDAWRIAGSPGELLLAGEGPERDRLESNARALGIRPVFLGHVADPIALLRECDVFALASDAEGMSNALLEAMGMGLACVATWIGGNVDALGPELSSEPSRGEYAEGSAGLLVRPGDPDGLAAALKRLTASAQLRDSLGQRARRRCERDYGIERVARKYGELIVGVFGSTKTEVVSE